MRDRAIGKQPVMPIYSSHSKVATLLLVLVMVNRLVLTVVALLQKLSRPHLDTALATHRFILVRKVRDESISK